MKARMEDGGGDGAVSRETIDRIRRFDGDGLPVLSLYLNLEPGPETARSIGARLKDLLKPLREKAGRGGLPHAAATSLREDVERILGLEGRISADIGHCIAVFSCSGRGFWEFLSLPRRVRDRAIADSNAWIRPLMAVLGEYHRFLGVVVDRERAWIHEFYMGQLVGRVERVDEGVRKKNFAGWYGLEEHRVRNRAREKARHHFRETAAIVREAFLARGADVIFLGGAEENVKEFTRFLPSDVRERVGGTFAVDTATMTPADVALRCGELERAWERRREEELARRLIQEAAGGTGAVLGLERTLDAVNSGAVDRLLVSEDATRPGARCPKCGWLGAVVKPCPFCDEPAQETPDVIDELVEATIDEGGQVEHVFAETALRESGVAAFVRFQVPDTGAGG